MPFNTQQRNRSHMIQPVQPQAPVKTATDAVCEYQEGNGAVTKFTFDDIKNFLCPEITPPEFAVLANICKGLHLNPFARDVFFIKYNGSPAQYIISKDAYEKSAESNPNYDGKQSGIVVKNEKGEIEYRTGALYIPGEEKLIGGWAEVYRKDRAHPDRSEVTFSEYDKGKSTWKQIPATMIQKVAVAQALRAAFPSGLAGTYTTDEMPGEFEAKPMQYIQPEQPVQIPYQEPIQPEPADASAGFDPDDLMV